VPIRWLLAFAAIELVGTAVVFAGIIVELIEHAPVGLVLITVGSLVFGIGSLGHAKLGRWFR